MRDVHPREWQVEVLYPAPQLLEDELIDIGDGVPLRDVSILERQRDTKAVKRGLSDGVGVQGNDVFSEGLASSLL